MDKGIEALIADMKEAALRATPGPWRRTSTQFNGITHGPFSFTKEDVLGHFAEKCNAEFVSGCDPKNVLALIAALERAQRANAAQDTHINQQADRIESLESKNAGLGKSLASAHKHIAELEAAPNGMMQLSNELAEMKRKCVELTVWYGAMPESNGKTNWTAILHRNGECLSTGITIYRSEYPDRVRYEADRMSHMIGELTKEPDILAYDANKHSGYTASKEHL
ncbi:Ead/Ea22-like protein [Buttiauxella sp. BIGb0552]|uniref:ead/Ea22-like family protein n=1 Tax=Buttiauxella sp. BIGb0552 TaxID=2485120 RepID=UPI0010658BE9|nr:ead/Ea22-like family protein [Buttiauxella sp. BIGb0552]TDX14591.1 Ead/Ea22-like protein [Buttiauxella sp. BIGb0552]